MSDVELLRDLHRRPPLVLPNCWDAASARAFAEAGFPAVATSSGAVARALGYEDHEQAPVGEVVAAIGRITRAVDVPVTADFEAGYGLAPADIVARLIEAGAAGCNLEDTDHRAGTQRPVEEHTEWLGTVVEEASGRLVVNARVDDHLHGSTDDEAAVARARSYLAAGADCTYPIGLLDEATVERLVVGIEGPVNALAWPDGPPVARLAELGVTRVTFGSFLFKEAMAAVRARAQELAP